MSQGQLAMSLLQCLVNYLFLCLQLKTIYLLTHLNILNNLKNRKDTYELGLLFKHSNTPFFTCKRNWDKHFQIIRLCLCTNVRVFFVEMTQK